MKLELEASCHAEVTASTADRPEEIGMRIFIHMKKLTIGCDHFRCEQVINGQPVFSDEIPNAAAKRDAAQTYRAGIAKAGDKSIRADGSCVFASGHSGFNPGGLIFMIDLQIFHRREVKHNAAFAGAVTSVAVTAAANGEFKAMFACQ